LSSESASLPEHRRKAEQGGCAILFQFVLPKIFN
jgi:hypothetical protein